MSGGKSHLLIFACHSLCFKQVFILLKPSQSIRHIISYCQVFHPLFSFYAELNMQMRLSTYWGCSSSFYGLDWSKFSIPRTHHKDFIWHLQGEFINMYSTSNSLQYTFSITAHRLMTLQRNCHKVLSIIVKHELESCGIAVKMCLPFFHRMQQCCGRHMELTHHFKYGWNRLISCLFLRLSLVFWFAIFCTNITLYNSSLWRGLGLNCCATS